MSMLSLLVIALLGESIWETLKMVWQTGKLSADKVGALIVGIALAVGTGLDLFALVGVPIHIPYLGMILTGILISRGANFVHDLLASVNNLQQNTKAAVITNFNEDTEKESGIDYKENEADQRNEVKQEQANPTAESNTPGTNTQPASTSTTSTAQ